MKLLVYVIGSPPEPFFRSRLFVSLPAARAHDQATRVTNPNTVRVGNQGNVCRFRVAYAIFNSILLLGVQAYYFGNLDFDI